MKKIVFLLAALLTVAMLLISGCDHLNKESKPVDQPKQTVAATVKMTFYTPTDDARGVKPNVIDVPADKATPKEALVALLEKEKKNEYSVFPKEMSIEKVEVKDHIAYVTTNEAFTHPVDLGNLTIKLELASLVNTITECKDIKGVVFLVQGKAVQSLGGIDMTEPLQRMESLIIKNTN